MTRLFIAPNDQRYFDFLLSLSKPRLIETARRERPDLGDSLIFRMTKSDLAEAIVKRPMLGVSLITGELTRSTAPTTI